MSVGSCGPFDPDDGDADTDYDKLAIEAEALRVENRILMRELEKIRAVIKSVTETLQKLTEEKQ